MRGRLLTISVVLGLLLGVITLPASAATPGQINTAIQNGLAWLATQQQPSGRIGSRLPLGRYSSSGIGDGE